MYRLAIFIIFFAVCLSSTVEAVVDVQNTAWLIQGEVIVNNHIDASLTPALKLQTGTRFSGLMEKYDFQAEISSFGLEYHTKLVSVFGGIREYTLTRARFNPVFLGGNNTSFPSVGYVLHGNNYTYQKIYGDLGVDDNYKRLGLHYVEFQPFSWLSMRLGEAMITSETYNGDFLYASAPFIPYYVSKYLPGIHSRPNNSSFYGDFEISFPQTSVYGELVVSEFPITPTATNPDLWGLTIGVETKRISNWISVIEYCRIQNYTYANNSVLDTTFSLGNRPLGHPLGDDLEIIDVHFTKQWTDTVSAGAGLLYRALGDTNLTDWYTSSDHWKQTRFLSGTVERTYGIRFGSTLQLQPNLHLDLEAEIGRSFNYQNQLDRTRYRHSGIITLRWHLP